MAVQAAFLLKDIPTGVAVVLSAQHLGGTITLSAALNIPNFNPDSIDHIGATQLSGIVPAQYLPAVLVVYDNAVTKAFQVFMILGCMMTLGACGMDWRFSKKKKSEPSADAMA